MSLPSLPGVYWFTGVAGDVLYVGKAKNLRNRVRSYTQVRQLQAKTRSMVLEAVALHTYVLQSELEALLVEAELIRTHQPRYNILLKDDKSPVYVLMTKDTFPKVLVVRKSDLKEVKGWVFGPFSSAFKLRQVLDMARRIFPWCSEGGAAKRPCFYSHIGLCPGVCSGRVEQKVYTESMRQLREFLHGRTRMLLGELRELMRFASQQHKYEDAALYRDRIRMVEEVTRQQPQSDVMGHLPTLQDSVGRELVVRLRRLLAKEFGLPREFLPNRIECYDVSNTQGSKPVVSMVVFERGQPVKAEYRSFNIRFGETPNDYAMLQEALLRRQNHPEWGFPDLILIDGGKGQLRAALKVWSWANPVLSLAKEPDRLMMQLSSGKIGSVEITDTNTGGMLAQQLRDEAHRFAKKLHSRRRTKSVVE